ncbi:MAG: dephospho-CoA kinase [Lachnospiraceae bacterium]|nr:dephospho-CoA kinase [Lachnospiraceae bacterium]
MVIGITGGVGTGKSVVLTYLKENYNATLLMADDIAKELLAPGKEANIKVREIYPADLFTPDGEIKRKEMAHFIFHHPDKLKEQNDIVFPMVKQYIKNAIKGADGLVVVEAAVLIEEHYDEICDVMWYIYSRCENRRERLKCNRGYSDDRIEAMMKCQLSEDEFRNHCQVVIDNDGELSDTYQQIDMQMKMLSEEK